MTEKLITVTWIEVLMIFMTKVNFIAHCLLNMLLKHLVRIQWPLLLVNGFYCYYIRLIVLPRVSL